MQHMAQGQGDHTAYGVFSFDPAVTLCMNDAGQIHMLSWMFLLVTNLMILTVKESDLCTWIAFFFPVPTKQRGLDGEIRANVALRIHQSGLHWDFFFPDHQYESPVTQKT